MKNNKKVKDAETSRRTDVFTMDAMRMSHHQAEVLKWISWQTFEKIYKRVF